MTTIRRASVEIMFRVRWIPVAVVLLITAAIIWTLLQPEAWSSALILVLAAIALAILGRDTPQ